jgi:hypothetical protein
MARSIVGNTPHNVKYYPTQRTPDKFFHNSLIGNGSKPLAAKDCWKISGSEYHGF